MLQLQFLAKAAFKYVTNTKGGCFLDKEKGEVFDLSLEWLPELGSNQRPAD